MARILVVEDSPTQKEELRLLLEEAGFSVETVENGQEALRSTRAAPPELILTDLRLPVMDGVALVEEIRRDYPFIPVVLMTAFGSEEIAAQALRAGAASYIPKRHLDLDLVSTLEEVLECARGVAGRKALARLITRIDVEFSLENDLAIVPRVVAYLEESLAAIGSWDAAEMIRTGVALQEAMMNAIEHGNLELGPGLRRRIDPSLRARIGLRRGLPPYCNRRVHVTARLSPVEAVFVIRDDGDGFDLSTLAETASLAALAQSNRRGLRLMHAFMDDVSHNEWGNEITLRARSRPAASA